MAAAMQPARADGRGERIRTSDPLLPKQVRYQAAPRPVAATTLLLRPKRALYPSRAEASRQ